MTRTPREIAGWSIAIMLVLFYALIPVIWIASLSLKPADQLSDKRFLPKDISWDNYDTIFSTSEFNRALVNSIGIAGISTLIAIVLASMAAYALSRLDFAGKAVILSGSLAVAMFPAISIVGSLFNIWRDVGLFDTWVGLIIPYMTFTLPLAIYTLSAFFREIPWELEQAAQVDGATPAPGLPQGDRAARRARSVHGGDPRLHLRLERLHLRQHAHLDRQRAHRARHAGVLHRRLAVRAADRRDLRGLDRRHGADRHPGVHLPAPHRRRA